MDKIEEVLKTLRRLPKSGLRNAAGQLDAWLDYETITDQEGNDLSPDGKLYANTVCALNATLDILEIILEEKSIGHANNS